MKPGPSQILQRCKELSYNHFRSIFLVLITTGKLLLYTRLSVISVAETELNGPSFIYPGENLVFAMLFITFPQFYMLLLQYSSITLFLQFLQHTSVYLFFLSSSYNSLFTRLLSEHMELLFSLFPGTSFLNISAVFLNSFCSSPIFVLNHICILMSLFPHTV